MCPKGEFSWNIKIPKESKGVLTNPKGSKRPQGYLRELKLSWESPMGPEGPQGVLCVLKRFSRIPNGFSGASSNYEGPHGS